jgi:predicted dehydrogenase
VTVVRVGLIGCGSIGRGAHLPALLQLSGAELVAIAESATENRTTAAAAAPHANVFDDYRDLIADGQVDAVVICLPPGLHAAGAIAAFEAGLHVYVEKPLAPSVAEGERMIAAWRTARTTGMVGFNFRFHPQVEEIRQRIAAGAIGQPLSVRSVFSIVPHAIPDWKQKRELGGGALLDLASHHLDLVHYLLGDPVARVFASVKSVRSEGDCAALQLELASGTSVQTFVSLGAVDENRMEIAGTAGKLTMDRTDLLNPAFVPATLRGARGQRIGRAVSALDPRLLLRSPGREPSFARALTAFVRAAAGEPFTGPDFSDGARNLSVIDAAERSAASGTAATPAWKETPMRQPASVDPARVSR